MSLHIDKASLLCFQIKHSHYNFMHSFYEYLWRFAFSLFFNSLSFHRDWFLFNRSNSLLKVANLTILSIPPQAISPCLGYSQSLLLEHRSPHSNFSLFSRALPHLIHTIFLLKPWLRYRLCLMFQVKCIILTHL